jgi:hypothetical protein
MTTAPMTDPFAVEAVRAAQFLGGGGSVAAKFPKPGFVVEGTIESFRMAQQTDMNSGELLFWEGKERVKQSDLKFPATAKPVDQLVIELQGEPTGVTWETNQYIEKALPEDDGMRVLYVKGRMAGAIGKAMKEAGVDAPEIGGYLKVARGADVKLSGSKFAHTFVAQYTPAAQNTKKAGQFLAASEGEAPNPFGPQGGGAAAPNPFGPQG